MNHLKITDYPHFIVVTCDPNATDWHVICGLDPDQENIAIEIAGDYLKRLPIGSQVGIAEVRTYGIVDQANK